MSITAYSKEFEGSHRNYNWPVQFDETDGFIGITQMKDDSTDRVLLSPKQVKELIAFVKRK